MTELNLSAEKREATGKGAARKIRQGGRIPAIIYGHGREPLALTISSTELEKVLSQTHGGSVLVQLTINGSTVRTLMREIQRHPTRRTPIHIDFLEVHAGERLRVDVPLVLHGSPDGVRNAGGVLEQFLRELEIEVLPRDIPERIEIDVTNMKVGNSLHVEDVTVENAKILTDRDVTICSVVPPRVEEEPEPEEVEEGAEEPELIRKPKAEGEEPEGESTEE
ncbi:MAG: 50S ribosomal protein L25/general stress protein Ctc [Gemmatimonadota bacterium]|nr:50S ribosomal protein L25/general stress protein Ctc [Gemmatimonadota bacterium]